ncbi:hypothetical protein GT23_4085 [Parageobacillus thermoglucosidasius]|nr:hypothetical protein GT23_4085 [Parageobacillus thermoglucosidasius]
MEDCVKQKKARASEKKHEKSNAMKTISKFGKNIIWIAFILNRYQK